LRFGTGSKILFSPEKLGGGGFQKMVLRKIVSVDGRPATA